MKEHPLLLVYKDTRKKSFPLILVVGREPNNTGKIGAWLGKYDWADPKNPSTRSCFWAVAHEALSYALDKRPPAIIKDICSKNCSSPIIITNAGTKCVPDASGQQNEVRKSSSPEERNQHILNLLNLLKKHDILRRIKWVWLCGIEKDFSSYKEQLLNGFKHCKIDPIIFYPPYLSRRRTPKLKEYIESCPQFRDEAKKAFEQFEEFIKKEQPNNKEKRI